MGYVTSEWLFIYALFLIAVFALGYVFCRWHMGKLIGFTLEEVYTGREPLIGTTHKHKRTGMIYRIESLGNLAADAHRQGEYPIIVNYVSSTGVLWSCTLADFVRRTKPCPSGSIRFTVSGRRTNATRSMSAKGLYVLGKKLTSGYCIEDTVSMTIIKKPNKSSLLLDRDGNAYYGGSMLRPMSE
jgi:hypothetical protein